MKLRFENNSLSDTIKSVVRSLIENDKETNGNIVVKYVPSDELENYDSEIPLAELQSATEVFTIEQVVCGSWNQPLGLVAVNY